MGKHLTKGATRLNAKEVLTKNWKLHFPGRRWNSQNFWVRTASENIHFNPGPTGTRRRGEEPEKFFKVIQMTGILHPMLKKTQPVMMKKRKMTSGRSQENLFIVITLYHESNCTCRKKKHFVCRRSASTLPERITHLWMS